MSNNKKVSVFGLYPTVQRAESAVDELVASGFSNADVSVLMADNQGSKFAHQKETKAPEGTATGVAAGGIGGALGLLAGIGALAIPGVGPFIAAGPIMGALAGLGVGGAIGRLVGACGDGHSGVRSEALRGPAQRGRHPHVDSLRHVGRDHARQGHPEADGRRGHCVGRRGDRRGDVRRTRPGPLIADGLPARGPHATPELD